MAPLSGKLETGVCLMSVAGIFASSLFSNALSQFGQKASTAVGQSGAGSGFAAIQQELSNLSSPVSGTDTLSTAITQSGQNFTHGHAPGVPTQTGTSTITAPTSSNESLIQPGKLGRESSLSTDPLAAAWQAYSSLQNPVNSMLNNVANSLRTNAGSLSINV